MQQQEKDHSELSQSLREEQDKNLVPTMHLYLFKHNK